VPKFLFRVGGEKVRGAFLTFHLDKEIDYA
jgi:hypothetical protein